MGDKHVPSKFRSTQLKLLNTKSFNSSKTHVTIQTRDSLGDYFGSFFMRESEHQYLCLFIPQIPYTQ